MGTEQKLSKNEPSRGTPVFRAVDLSRDRERLLNFDASFTTDRIYTVQVNEMQIEIAEKGLDAPLHKRYPMVHVVSELMSASFAGTSLVAETGGAIAGFSVMKFEAWNSRAHLAHLYVAPAFQGGGLGRSFIEKAVAFGRESSARCLWLETQNVNYPAIQFYTKMGFRLCGFDNTLYEPADPRGEAALYFAMEL